jgi:transposase
MRPVSVFANGPVNEIELLQAGLRGPWRQATRAVMVLLSLHGLAPSQIAELLDCHPATVRRWISRFSSEGLAGLADRPRSGRPRLGGRRLTGRIAALLARPGPWTLPRIRRYLGWPQVSMRTLYRRVRLVAIWRRPKLTARGDPDHDHVVAQIAARLTELPRRAVVLAEDETHLNLLPHVRASWTLRTVRPKILTPGTNRQVTVFGAIEVSTGAWVYRLGRHCGRLHRPAGHAGRGIPAGPGDRGDLRQRQHPPRPQGHRLPQGTPPAGAPLRRPVQPARQPGRDGFASVRAA